MALADHAKKRHSYPGSGCWCCNLPPKIRKEIDDNRRLYNVGPDTVIDWLVDEQGYDRTACRRGAIAAHFRARHHES